MSLTSKLTRTIIREMIKNKIFIFQKKSYVILTNEEYQKIHSNSAAYERIKEFVGKH